MAQRLSGPCATPTCNALAALGKSYCDACKTEASKQFDQRRGTAHERGYDATWQHFRRWFLWQPENIICADCKRLPSRDVHHVVKVRDAPERKLDPSNCIALCTVCHSRRTNRGE